MKRKMMMLTGAFLISISLLNAQHINRDNAKGKAKQAKEVAANDAKKVEAIRNDLKHSDALNKAQKDALNKDYTVARKNYKSNLKLAENNKDLLNKKYTKEEQAQIIKTYNEGKEEYKSDKKNLIAQQANAKKTLKNGGNAIPSTKLNAAKIHKRDRKYYNNKKNIEESTTPPIINEPVSDTQEVVE